MNSILYGKLMEKTDAQRLSEELDVVSMISSKVMRDTMLSGSQMIQDILKKKPVTSDEKAEVLDNLKESFKHTSHVKAAYLIDLAIDVIEMSENGNIEDWRYPEKKKNKKAA